MSTLYSIFQGVLGAGVLLFFGALLFDSGSSALFEVASLVAIGAVIYGVLWLVHRLVVGNSTDSATSFATKSQRTLSIKICAATLLFATLVLGVSA
ncbi:hypothetical protein NBRC116590_18350 [Pelagimonas sp. KU-00592-HH]|uniref:hypothetical protein n=1 Tax=Pelagimonas sp. KU-00592-HH TaxID=3127651 RepID=UPI0031026358